MLSDEEMRARMRKGWRAGKPETICGNGSLRIYSQRSRETLPRWCAKYEIRSVCDAGAGDLHYARGIEWDVEYRAFDLFPRFPEVQEIDVTTETLPACDAILCRMVLNHLDAARIRMALARFRESGRYLIATQFNGEDLPQRSTQFMRLDLREFGLGEPLEQVQDGAEECCSLALWSL